MRRKQRDPNENVSISAMRDNALEFLIKQYDDAQRYVAELRRAINSFTSTLQPDSPYRYVGMDATRSILKYLRHVNEPKTVPELIKELTGGKCFMGVVKSNEEAVTKAVNSSVRFGKLVWMDKKKTLVGIPEWLVRKEKP